MNYTSSKLTLIYLILSYYVSLNALQLPNFITHFIRLIQEARYVPIINSDPLEQQNALLKEAARHITPSSIQLVDKTSIEITIDQSHAWGIYHIAENTRSLIQLWPIATQASSNKTREEYQTILNHEQQELLKLSKSTREIFMCTSISLRNH